MKKLIVILTLILTIYPLGWAISADDEKEGPKSICPKTLMSEDCTSCHTVPNWKIKESDFTEGMKIPPGLEFIDREGKRVGYFSITGTVTDYDADRMRKIYEWYIKHPEFERYLILELNSPGGGMMSMKRIKGYIDMFKNSGGIVQTFVAGWAASAAFDILISGTLGKRYVHPQAILMWHEVSSIKWGIFVESVSDLEDQGKVMRYFQQVENEWIASRSKVTTEKLDEMIKRKELWVSGIEAVEKYGFADYLVENVK